MINQTAIAIRLIVKISNRTDAEVCEIVTELPEIIFAQHFGLLAIWAAGHDDDRTMFAVCSPNSQLLHSFLPQIVPGINGRGGKEVNAITLGLG
jgi:hypothetical protein